MISRSLKQLAKELNIPIVALSQLNRSVESRQSGDGGSKRPQLSDLRESGAIEQDADMVMFIHRPEKYGIETDSEGNSTKGIANIIIAKHRNGAVGEINLRFRAELTRFEDLNTTSPFASNVTTGEFVTQTFVSKMNGEGGDGGFPVLEQEFEHMRQTGSAINSGDAPF